jgi:putative salt-induced outer membrane protein YdiY
MTQGNRDSSTANLSYDLRHRTESPFEFQSKGLILRGSTEGELTTSRYGFEARVDRRFGDRTSLFAQTQYLRDRFKEIDYLVSPTAGVSHLVITNDLAELGLNVGVGSVWEKNRDFGATFDGALSAGQQFKRRLSDTAQFTQSVAALWKVRDFADGLYTLNLGLTASLTTRTQLKLELVDTFKNRRQDPTVEQNDVSVIVSVVFKH